MRQLAARYPRLPDSLEGCHQIIEEQNCLIREYRQQGKELTELISELTDRISNQNSVSERSLQYVDHISHEFRTPLSVILDYLTILDRGFSGKLSSEQRMLLNTIAAHANELSGMVDDILDVRRIDAGVLAMNRVAASVDQIIERVETVLIQKARPRNASLSVQIDANLPLVFADAEKIGRVILNLGMNAIKFSGSPGSIQIAATQAESFVRISVKDNGNGIEDKDLAKIFERFEQLDIGSWSSTRGFGLGLVIARELVELNFGSIYVASSDAGTEFSFTIPIADAPTIVRCYADYLTRHHLEIREVEAFRVLARPYVADNEEKIEQFLYRSLHASEMLLPIRGGWLLFSKPSLSRSTIDRLQSLLDKSSNQEGSASRKLVTKLIFRGSVEELPGQVCDQLRSENRYSYWPTKTAS